MGINAEKAVMSIYENESLTGELTDQPAKTLLKWCEGQVMGLVKQHDDEETFEREFKVLRDLTRQINQLSGTAPYISTDEQQELMGKIVMLASELGFTIPPETSSRYLTHITDFDDTERTRKLIELITPPDQSKTLV